jgi:hypothetical protein
MQRAHVDISHDLDGDAVVHAVFDLSPEQVAAAAHAVRAVAGERFRMSEISADDVLELRELTALADELGELTGGASTVVLRPARLSALRDSVAEFVQSRDEAEWTREDDREVLPLLRELLLPLEQLSGEATRSALLSPQQPAH